MKRSYALYIILFCCFIFCNEIVHAQTEPVIEDDENLVVADSSLFTTVPTKIDSFYDKFNISLHNTDRPELYQEIFRWYRTCYRYGGGSNKGIDCSHFVNMLYEKVYGVKLNNSSGSIFAQCKVVKGGKDEFEEGDLLFFKIKRRRISHIAIYLQNGKFAHATTKAGVIISDLREPYYHKHFYKAGRLSDTAH